jgi:hypothetical protein
MKKNKEKVIYTINFRSNADAFCVVNGVLRVQLQYANQNIIVNQNRNVPRNFRNKNIYIF